ncbi:MAG: radical SAM/Cys-rich domain protein [Methylococcales symbiont of Iophon sp. n. MRB-2018]|nr:MAG: radical SAM/Cys-rich domain protein [Methylococcales symbiont of Iophon sp. n. MRB-2018]KAF3979677.1 MAG: radical SAM/Cys-rich domain protein [Methylococcales symbiont of Iophon sp. n. MRB-2018]
MHDTLPYLEKTTFPAITRNDLEVLQVNLGYLCNLSCTHCHVNAGPNRTELMDQKTIDHILDFIDCHSIKTLDLTGGAPEMNPLFKNLVEAAIKKSVKVIDRCNLTILLEPDYLQLAEFLAENKVEIVASLPCYMEDNVDKQRGKGVFNASITALQKLNGLGYGKADSGLIVNLVFNPQGATLPPEQNALEQAYKQHLYDQFNIVFNQLFAMTNLPIQRFGSALISKGEFAPYMQLLEDNFQQQNLEQVMCKNTLSIDWQGFVYDCDFNQMLHLPLGGGSEKIHISALTDQVLAGHPIKTLQHCYGCTAGQGSSCGGAL